ncbi:hypothetical protein AB0E59_38975 [Lentzea sp. NPDC034063]|uniref:hypothetical protein n=1 Tax=unclassified Lentzea TaxID=2643253 RepID=UPI0033DABFBB
MTRRSGSERSSYDVVWPAIVAAKLKKPELRWQADAIVNFVYTELAFDPTEFGVYGRKFGGEKREGEQCEGEYSVIQKHFFVIYELKGSTLTVVDVRPRHDRGTRPGRR